ncbi:polysaccharide deacetylase family protein [Litchfieldia alkalitelluris]|uniref:polysaccharide deacetylase family protein n=1 Tax=Litchfieldia alkalitelluris TaxID=304268 RepID=UPI000998A444|nr:polysaccharide deacetylase family protein [Litchfieldia alkalitelluris]
MKYILFLIVSLVLLTSCQEGKNNSDESEIKVKHHAQREQLKREYKKDFVRYEIDDKLYKINSSNWSIEPIDPQTNKKVVLLTIDDAPDQYSVEMAKILKEHNVSAIFFVNGHFLQSEEGRLALREIVDLGHMIGNHTMNHHNLRDLTDKETNDEITTLNNLIEEVTGTSPVFFRAPFGINTEASLKIVASEEMSMMNWTYGYDWEKEFMSKDALADIMVNSPLLLDGANILMHDREWTKEALSDIVKGLRNKDYEIINPNTIKVGD